jgi:hypothetical protein
MSFVTLTELGSFGDLGSSSNIRPLPTIAEPVATRWRFLERKAAPFGGGFLI